MGHRLCCERLIALGLSHEGYLIALNDKTLIKNDHKCLLTKTFLADEF